MAFTATDLANIESAIVKLASGVLVVECEINGDMVQYNRANLKQMLALRDLIKSELAAESSTYSSRGNTRIAVTTKGY